MYVVMDDLNPKIDQSHVDVHKHYSYYLKCRVVMFTFVGGTSKKGYVLKLISLL
jgi:hypothetical protein